MENKFIQQLPEVLQLEIEELLKEEGIEGEDLENAMNSRLSDLSDIIDISEIEEEKSFHAIVSDIDEDYLSELFEDEKKGFVLIMADSNIESLVQYFIDGGYTSKQFEEIQLPYGGTDFYKFEDMYYMIQQC